MAASDRRNLVLLWIRGALLVAATTLASSSVLSGYLLYVGIPDGKIGTYLAIVPVVNLVVSLLCSPVSVRLQNSTLAISVFPC